MTHWCSMTRVIIINCLFVCLRNWATMTTTAHLILIISSKFLFPLFQSNRKKKKETAKTGNKMKEMLKKIVFFNFYVLLRCVSGFSSSFNLFFLIVNLVSKSLLECESTYNLKNQLENETVIMIFFLLDFYFKFVLSFL